MEEWLDRSWLKEEMTEVCMYAPSMCRVMCVLDLRYFDRSLLEGEGAVEFSLSKLFQVRAIGLIKHAHRICFLCMWFQIQLLYIIL